MINRPDKVKRQRHNKDKHNSHWFSQSAFSSESSKYRKSQTVRARKLNFLENFHPPTTCQISHFTCPVSHVTCHLSHFFLTKRWRLLVEGLLSTGPTQSSFCNLGPKSFLPSLPDSSFFGCNYFFTYYSKVCFKENMTKFQIKGGRWVRRRDIFEVSGKRYK